MNTFLFEIYADEDQKDYWDAMEEFKFFDKYLGKKGLMLAIVQHGVAGAFTLAFDAVKNEEPITSMSKQDFNDFFEGMYNAMLYCERETKRKSEKLN